MEGKESKSQSPGQDSQNMPENSSHLAENTDGFKQRVNELRKLLDPNEDFSEIIAEIYNRKKSKLTKLVTELSQMHEALADQKSQLVKEISKNTHTSTTPIKTQQVSSSSTSTSPQVSQTSKTEGYEATLNTTKGGFNLSALSSKETKVHDPDALLEKISDLEKEAVSLWDQIQNLTDTNEILEAAKAKVADLKITIIESDRKIETMGKEIEGSRKEVLSAENEISKLKEEQTELLSTIESIGQNSASLNEQLGLQQNRESELEEKVKLALAEIANRDEQIAELKTQIDELGISHAAKENRWKADMKRLKTDLRRNYDREVSALKKENKNLREENAMIESMKANVAELKDTISESNSVIRMKEMTKVLEASRQQVIKLDNENKKMKQEMSNKAFGEVFNTVEKQITIDKQDEEVKGLNAQINQLQISHAAEVDKLNADVEMWKTKFKENCEYMEDLKNMLLN